MMMKITGMRKGRSKRVPPQGGGDRGLVVLGDGWTIGGREGGRPLWDVCCTRPEDD